MNLSGHAVHEDLDPPTHVLAEQYLRLHDHCSGAPPARRSAMRAEFDRLGDQLAQRIGVNQAAILWGRVLIPLRRAGLVHVLILEARDLDLELLDEREIATIEAAERAIAGRSLPAVDRERLANSLLIQTECSGAEVEDLIRLLAESRPEPPLDLADFGQLARSLLARLRGDSQPPSALGTDPGLTTDHGFENGSIHFPFEDQNRP